MYHQFIRLIAVAIKVITAFSKRKGREFRQQNPGETLEREKYKEVIFDQAEAIKLF